MSTLRRNAALPFALGLLVAACGGSSGYDGTSSDTGAPVPTLTVTSLDSLKFDPSTLTAPAGKIKFVHESKGSVAHSFVIEGKFKLVGNDDKTVEFEPGEYEFFCDVPGHREAGMKGTLTVTPR